MVHVAAVVVEAVAMEAVAAVEELVVVAAVVVAEEDEQPANQEWEKGHLPRQGVSATQSLNRRDFLARAESPS